MRAVRHAVLCAIAASALIGQAVAQCDRYAIQIVQPDCTVGIAFSAWGISEDDRLCGYYHCGASTNDTPFVWKDGILTDIPLLPGMLHGRTFDINSDSQAVGRMGTTGGNYSAFLYDDEQLADLGFLRGAGAAEALAISSGGIVCGYANGPSLRAFWWDGQLHEIIPSFGPSSVANDISDVGAICGWMGVAPISGFVSHAFIWQDGKILDLGTIPGGMNAEAVAINNNGEILIRGWTNGPTLVQRGYLWRSGRWIDLGLLPGTSRCLAQDLNDESEIVGYCSTPGLTPFIWRDGIMTSLRDLVPPGSPYLLGVARGVNNSRKIAANASTQSGDSYAVLLSPVPGLPGDVNCDNIIGVSDLLWVIGHWGLGGGGTIADLNSDGTVDIHDLLLVITNWNAA